MFGSARRVRSESILFRLSLRPLDRVDWGKLGQARNGHGRATEKRGPGLRINQARVKECEKKSQINKKQNSNSSPPCAN